MIKSIISPGEAMHEHEIAVGMTVLYTKLTEVYTQLPVVIT